MYIVLVKMICFLLLPLTSCSRPHGEILSYDLRGDWRSVNHRSLNMSATLSFTDSDACYGPAMGDTSLYFHAFKIVEDTLILNYQGIHTYRCHLRELHDSILRIQGLPWHECSERFIRYSKKDYNEDEEV